MDEKRLAEIAARLGAIETRKAEIGTAMETKDEKVSLEEVRKEAESLNAEVAKLKAEETEIKKAAEAAEELTKNPAKGQVIENRKEDAKMEEMEIRKGFMDYVQTGKMTEEYRAAVTTTDAGVAIPTVVSNKIWDALQVYGNILPEVDVEHYKGGLQIPVLTLKPTAEIVGEGATSADQKVKTGFVSFNYYKLRCKVPVTLETSTMAIDAFEAKVVAVIAEAMAKAIDNYIVNGTGVNQPKGILAETVADADRNVTLAKMNFAQICAMEAAIPAAYDSVSKYVMNKKTFMALYSMKDNNNSVVIGTGLGGKPSYNILGRDVILTDLVPSIDSSKAGATVAFSMNLKDYVVNTNLDVSIKKYEDQETDDQVTKAVMLFDGKAVITDSLVLFKKASA